ncbi:MAG: zinc-binding dehydrogenase [Chthonomonadales bacterium]|nr:zinc-binding dehydrogenase [Chthonomonadales bacterium]
MPREIVTTDGSSFRIRSMELPPLGPRDVRVRTRFAAPKHGTETHSILGSPFDFNRWDRRLRMFLPREEEEAAAPRDERPVGNIAVGVVTEVGPEVSRWRTGDAVFGYGRIREVNQALEDVWRPLAGLSDEDAVCVDPAHVAFVAVRDGKVRIGDHVAVFGLGAIGLMAAQVARAGGARRVFVIDPLEMRRNCAAAHGADAALDPLACDAALAIKEATDGAGVDVSIETSGSARALHEAIRCIRQCGTVVHVPWGPRDCAELHLDEEFHLNRPTLVGSQAWPGWGNPDRDYPVWDWERASAAAADLLRDGLIASSGVVTPIVSFDEAPEALPAMFTRPETTIKLGVRFAE